MRDPLAQIATSPLVPVTRCSIFTAVNALMARLSVLANSYLAHLLPDTLLPVILLPDTPQRLSAAGLSSLRFRSLRFRSLRVSSLLLAAALLLPPLFHSPSAFVAQAATLERLSFDDMVAKSTTIVRGRIGTSFVRQHGSVLYTHYSVQVLEQWKGLPAAQLDVVLPGGTLTLPGNRGQLQQVAPGAPSYSAGQELVLFLWTSPSGLTHVIGLSQGSFLLQKDANGQANVERAAITEGLYTANGRPVHEPSVRMSLTEFDRRVRSSLNNGGAKR